ncbi:atrial natriuretic peptide receptor 1 isoform X2 [Homalodisca vitripennis]|uniref:atrial natriuretic peptide receptor 1 isoform X2 n=1 Tax=Homalodisca vitripennis TaxID=197043 RepID=UPI001EECBB10|nr:atrial natriuretic peptide receptor 1 isoform X2 [Homalodisca vitripennis]
MPSLLTPLLLLLSLARHAVLLSSDMRYYNVGVLMASRLDSPFDLERCGPAIDLALEEINDKFLSEHRVRLQKVQESYPSCSGDRAPGLAADMHFRDDVIAFIGPACAFALEPVARLAAYWNTPIITGMGDQPPSEGTLSVTSGILGRLHKLRNGSSLVVVKEDTLTRMSYCQCRLKLVFSSIFKQFSWNHVALLLDRSDLFSLTVGKHLEIGLRRAGTLSFVRELDGNEEDNCQAYLRDASMYARVVILSVRGLLVRRCMIAAHHLGMTRGDWTFLDVEIVQGSYWGDHDWEVGDENDSIARKAYEALLRVSLLEPKNKDFSKFVQDVKHRAKLHYNYTFSEGEEVNFFVGAFYDGVFLLGLALNETLTEGLDIRNGRAITRKMWGKSFQGITGHVRIDENGERDADYSVLDLDPITGKFEVVAHYYGINRKYKQVANKRIHWPGGKEGPPPDVPPCGFMGNDPSCLETGQNNDLLLYGMIAISIFLGFTFVLVFFANKHMRLAADLNNMSWKVRPEEVLLEIGKPFSSRLALQRNLEMYENGINGLHERLTVRRSSIESSTSLLPTQMFTTIGIYKGSRVAIKKVIKKKVDINKKLLWEIKQGSLKDVLENEAIQLDWNFRMSLIHDIVKGMAFLHGCEVAVHGKLRSCNCLIDGRFVLKISDFGLHTLTTPSEVVKDNAFYNKLLWIAPELLKETTVPGHPASQKGDVYSFSIILEEIVVRGGPYELARQTLSIQEILHRVESYATPPFRPDLSDRDCPDDLMGLMERCWADNPDERPSFEIVRGIIRKIMKGYCENLMDDLLRRMEQYANNLEALVEEKTDQLSQEKRRSEELLFQVLPRPVAQQLMAGEMVQPEQFECVTVYFSDIVGFTALCAQSTPMQVVTLLNDLYSTFDRAIGFYDVYKVETIGDAYMVVSGLPERNGDNHAREISLMALSILDALHSFSIQHRPDSQLKVRIGIHSGPVCAGVVGQKMPHYCLFGDTVNTASRMESSGQPLRIHVSEATKQILDKFGTFQLELRGEVELKGKGRVVTHWLLGCSEPDPRPPTPLPSHSDNADNNPYPLIFPELSVNIK